jgi:tRNA pseudouridine38-40 synthase
LTRLFELSPESWPGSGAAAAEEASEETGEQHRGAALAGPLRRVVVRVAYDGTGYRGFARQPGGVRTVGGELAAALEQMAGGTVDLVCAGRTDAGVHATGQVVHVDLPEHLFDGRRRGAPAGSAEWLARALTHQLDDAIVVTAAAFAPQGFHARHSAVARRYRYQVLNRPMGDPLLARTAWHVEAPLDVNAMRIAADGLLGEHDFAAFCRRPPDVEPGTPIVRRVISASWTVVRDPVGLLRFEMEANAFCHQMVRSVVGALIAAGTARLDAARIFALLRSGERAGAPRPAPACGLCLVEVRYAEDPFAGTGS